MSQQQSFPFPIHLLVLDAIGALMVAVGIVEWSGTKLLPDGAYRFENDYMLLAGIGVLLMLPMVLHAIRMAKARARQPGD